MCQFKEMKNLSENIACLESQSVLHSTGVEYFPKQLAELTENQMDQADRLIDLVLNYSDVIKVYDNIKDYPSNTCKLFLDSM